MRVLLASVHCEVVNGEWTSELLEFEPVLNTLEEGWREGGGSGPSSGADPDYASAVYMLQLFGGELLDDPKIPALKEDEDQ